MSETPSRRCRQVWSWPARWCSRSASDTSTTRPASTSASRSSICCRSASSAGAWAAGSACPWPVFAAAVGLAGDLAAGAGLGHGVTPAWNAVARLGVFVIVALIIHRLTQALAAQRDLARTDGLTGAANARWFAEVARRELAGSHRYGTALTLAYVDLDQLQVRERLHGPQRRGRAAADGGGDAHRAAATDRSRGAHGRRRVRGADAAHRHGRGPARLRADPRRAAARRWPSTAGG